jgi:hypothetical protein
VPAPPRPELDEIKPLLRAHAAMTAGRQAAATALREVLRDLYPAALRAYADPAEPLPLRILAVFPEPGMLVGPDSHSHETALVAELTAMGCADASTATAAVNALRTAVDETSRAGASPWLAPAVAQSVRCAVLAVLDSDAASTMLIENLVQCLQDPSAARRSSVAYHLHDLAWTDSPVPVPKSFDIADLVPYSTSGTNPYGAAGKPVNGSTPTSPPAVSVPGPRAQLHRPAPGSRDSWPLNPPPDDDDAVRAAPASDGVSAQVATALAFDLDPLNAPIVPDHTLVSQPWLAGELPAEPPLLGLPDPLPLDSVPAQPSSMWFAPVAEGEPTADDARWGRSVDAGWQAAQRSANPTVGASTSAGLPRRVPQTNLVPGAAPVLHHLRVIRDPRSIAAHTAGYFRGWRRGQEIAGFAVGQRDRAAWEFNRDQRARMGTQAQVQLS